MKTILKLTILVMSLMYIHTYAKESIYYVNENNVSFTKEQYDYFTVMFYDGYQDFITQEEFNSYEGLEMKKEDVKVKYFNEIMPLSTIHETTAKQLKISTSKSSSFAKVAVVLTWKNNPTVRSYDLMGAYLEDIELHGNVTTKVSYSNSTFNSNEIQNFYNGFGVSIKLPSTGNNIVVSQSFETTLGGTIYASYQHATSNISLATSKKYSVSLSGYGNVFLFDTSVKNYFDQMGGVDIDV